MKDAKMPSQEMPVPPALLGENITGPLNGFECQELGEFAHRIKYDNLPLSLTEDKKYRDLLARSTKYGIHQGGDVPAAQGF